MRTRISEGIESRPLPVPMWLVVVSEQGWQVESVELVDDWSVEAAGLTSPLSMAVVGEAQ